MKVLVDTSIWSQVLRRKEVNQDFAKHLTDLVQDLRVVIIGPIRQELLSGISDEGLFLRLRQQLAAFDDEPLLTSDFESAADLNNHCRRNGVQGSLVDFLICSVAINRGYEVWTDDADFSHYACFSTLQLHARKSQ